MNTNEFSNFQLEEVRHHLSLMISKEKQNGEFLLASVVQDSLLYNFHNLADSPDLMDLAHIASELAVTTTAQHMGLNEFTLCESIRGVMHSMVTLGGEPIAMAVAVTTGGLSGIQNEENSLKSAYAKAIVIGVCTAADDMGLNLTVLRQVTRHMTQVKYDTKFITNDSYFNERYA